MHFIFVRKPPWTKYKKITCIRNILDFTVHAHKKWIVVSSKKLAPVKPSEHKIDCVSQSDSTSLHDCVRMLASSSTKMSLFLSLLPLPQRKKLYNQTIQQSLLNIKDKENEFHLWLCFVLGVISRLKTYDLKRQCHDNRWFFGSHFVWGKIMAATGQGRGKRQLLEENDIFSTQLGRWSCSRGWPSCHGLMSATLAWAVAIFSSRKKAQKITEYRDTAPLIIWIFSDGRQKVVTLEVTKPIGLLLVMATSLHSVTAGKWALFVWRTLDLCLKNIYTAISPAFMQGGSLVLTACRNVVHKSCSRIDVAIMPNSTCTNPQALFENN